jgi:hypothetical protein
MESFFYYLNLFPLPVWLGMILAPNHPLTERASRSSVLLSLAALNYVGAMIIAFKQGVARESIRPGLTPLARLQSLLGTPSGALATWGHMLALDLFAGAWIYRQARRLNAPVTIRLLALSFTLMTGPFGLLIFLLWRMVIARQSSLKLDD